MTALDRILPILHLLEVDVVDLAVPLDRAWEKVRRGGPGTFETRPRAVRFAHASEPAPGISVGHVLPASAPGEILARDVVVRARTARPQADPASRPSACGVPGRPSPRDGWREVADGIGGAAIMTACFLTPFMLNARNHWGLSEAEAERSYAGDELIPQPRWSWTHGIEIAALPERVWPWIAQIGAGRAGFYSYQWLENLLGCELSNAESVHDEWAVEPGGTLHLHPEMPPLVVVSFDRGKSFVAHAPADPAARTAGKPWAETTWLFFLEPMSGDRSRFISRFRCNCSDDLRSQLLWSPRLLEPVGFAMDRRMLKGVKERVERTPAPLKNLLVR